MIDGDRVPEKRLDRAAASSSQAGNDSLCDDISAEDLEAGWKSWVMPYLEDSALGPVLIVLVIHVVAFTAPVILFAVVDRSIPAMLALAWLLYLSYKLLRADYAHHGSFGKISWLLISTWLLSCIAAYASARIGLF